MFFCSAVDDDINRQGQLREQFALENGYCPHNFNKESDDTDGTRKGCKRRAYFSEFFADFVVKNCIPRKTAMRFVKDLKRNRAIFDVDRMNITWSSLAKLDKRLKDKMKKKIKPLSNQRGKSDYVHIGLARTIDVMLPGLLKRTFPNGNVPDKPHVQIEMWTDGIDLFHSGIKKQLWPVCVRPLAIGYSHDSVHVPVPPHASRPNLVTFYLGCSKPTEANVIIRDVVDELLVLDPRTTKDEKPKPTSVTEEAWKAKFTVSLRRGNADSPARCLIKNIYGHVSACFCEKCVVEYLPVEGQTRIYPTYVGELRTKERFLEYPKHVKKVSNVGNIAQRKYHVSCRLCSQRFV